MEPGMPKLLVSVRTVEEAQAALSGGADWIDVKEPQNGALGRADPKTLLSISNEIHGTAPLSAALGELSDWNHGEISSSTMESYSLVKVGTARSRNILILNKIKSISEEIKKPIQQFALAAYADHDRAESPSPQELPSLCADIGIPFLLIDTHTKDSTHLFDWLDQTALGAIQRSCKKHHVKLALAGRISLDHVDWLKNISPDIVGVRSSVCQDGQRNRSICPERVQFWKSLFS